MKLCDINNLEEGRLKNLALGGALLGAGLGIGHMLPHTPKAKTGAYRAYFHSKEHETEKQQLKDKAQQLRDRGLTKGTFIHGKLQEPDDESGSSTATSDDAADYLK